jgi:hypothetical protein
MEGLHEEWIAQRFYGFQSAGQDREGLQDKTKRRGAKRCFLEPLFA